MNKLIRILSLGALVFSNISPIITLADWEELDWNTCFTYAENSTTRIAKYICPYEDVIIPETVRDINWDAFEWKTIRTIQIPDSIQTTYEMFRWAILNWDMTFDNWKFSNSTFEGAIIWENWNVTIWNEYNLSRIKINEWGELTINWWQITYMSSLMEVDWRLNINWEGSLSNAFQNMKLGENWSVIFWNWITSITNNSFYWSVITWNIVFPNDLEIIWNSAFANARITTWLNFPDSLELMEWSAFQLSKIEWDLKFWESTTTIKWFYQSTITWDMVFRWTELTLENFYNVILNWSFLCEDCGNIEMKSSSITSVQWDFKIISNWNFNIRKWGLSIWSVWRDFVLSWIEVPLDSILQGVRVWRDMTIRWNKISIKYWALNGTNVAWDFKMYWDSIELDTDVVNSVTVAWDLEISAWLLKANNWVLNSLKVWWQIKLPENSEFWNGVLWWVISKWISAMWDNTTVSIWETVTNSSMINDIMIVVNEVETNEVETVNDKTTIQNAEIQATSGKVVEFQWGLEVYFQNSVWQSERIEWTARFSSPIAIKVPVLDLNSEYVKIKVKHEWEDFWFTGLTLNPQNQCVDWIASADQYSWDDVKVEEDNNGKRYAVIYTCSASTFIAYTENEKKNNENNSTTVNTVTSSSSSWYWRRSNETNKNTNEQHNVANEQEKQDTSISEAISEIEEINIEEESKNNTVKNTVISNNPKYTQEQNNAYSFAKSNWITTTESIETAKMNTNLKRIEMAKILSNYAINVLWYEPDLSIWTIDFKDVPVELDNQYDNWVTLAYQLWIMWINMKNNKFRPFDEVTRVEFITALSRLLYNTKDWTGKTKYYEPHITKLYNEWIITNTNPNPNLKEKRGNVFIMLMRATNK